MIRNLTPHDIHIRNQSGVMVTIPRETPTGARASMTEVPDSLLIRDRDGSHAMISTWEQGGPLPEAITIVEQRFGAPEGLPDPVEGTYLIVSRITANSARASGRSTTDLLMTADIVRDDEGRIVGCRALSRL